MSEGRGHAGRAIVTGASGGLGLEFARLLAADGYDLVLIARSSGKLGAIADDLRARFGVAVETIVQDMSAPRAAAAIYARISSCDVLINNAGFASSGRFDTIPIERSHEEMQLDMVALTELTHVYLPGMIERRRGRVMNLASTAAFLPGPFMAVYYAAKAYVLSFSEALGEELRGTGVTVTALCPGATATGFSDRANLKSSPLFTRLRVADAPSVASIGYRGMLRGESVVIPGLTNKIMAVSSRFAPRRLLLSISRRLVE